MKIINRIILALFIFFSPTLSLAQTSDSLIVRHLEKCGVTFSCDNSVTLLMTGQEKFDDLFKAIEEARSSIHMEYFN